MMAVRAIAGPPRMGARLADRYARHLLHRLVALANRHFEPVLQTSRRMQQVLAALGRRAGKRRISEMAAVANTRAILLGLDLSFEIGRDLLELADHLLEILDPAGFFVGFEAERAYCRLRRLHSSIPQTNSNVSNG